MELGRSLKRWQTPAECIKEVIADSNHSRDWWAVELGYHRETLGRICRGQQRVSAEFAVRFENAVRYVKARHLLYLQAEMELRDYLQNETERRRA
jgi:plasmid maintenance system antidote protein VapI